MANKDDVVEVNIADFIRLKQAKMCLEEHKEVSIADVKKLISEETGISVGALNNIVSGRYYPNVIAAIKLAKALDTKVECLYHIKSI